MLLLRPLMFLWPLFATLQELPTDLLLTPHLQHLVFLTIWAHYPSKFGLPAIASQSSIGIIENGEQTVPATTIGKSIVIVCCRP
ncbi:hypothetical protein BKA70DRAFT_1327367, partial [Coprinopsis sp. MPI-PUGE-AT-0042]